MSNSFPASVPPEEFKTRVRRYLDQALVHTLAGPDFESPARALFSYCALLVSALAHPDHQGCFGRCFLDLVIEADPTPVRLTTFADCDHDYLEALQCPPRFEQRIHQAKSISEGPYHYQWLVNSPLGTTDQPMVKLALGAWPGCLAHIAIVAEEIGRIWQRLLENERQSRSVSAAINAWMAASSEDWPDALQSHSLFDRHRDKVLERLRDLLDHLEFSFSGASSPNQHATEPSIYFLRKTRYYGAWDAPVRTQVCRRISEEVSEHYLLGYFLSWSQTKALSNLRLERKPELIDALQRAAEQSKVETPQIDALLAALQDTGLDASEEQQQLLRALESPIGDVPPERRQEIIRSVADTMFVTSVPEIIWDLDQDPRYFAFRDKAPPAVTTVETWLWGRSPNQTSTPATAESAPTAPKALLFVPLPAGRDPLFGAYLPIQADAPLASDAAVDRLAQLGHRAIDAERATVQFFLDAYSNLLVEAFAEHYLLYLAEISTETGVLDRETHRADLLRETNEAFKAISLVMDLPRMRVGPPDTIDQTTFWDAFQDSALVSGVRYGATPENPSIGLRPRQPQWLSSPEVENARRLDWITASFAKQAPSAFTKYIHDRFQRLMGLYLENELPYQLSAMKKQGEASRERTVHSLKHELKDLVAFARDSADGHTRLALDVILNRLDDVSDHGLPQISGDPRGECDARHLVEEFLQDVYPHPSTLDGIPLEPTRHIFAPAETARWDIKIAPAYLTALYCNLTRNATNALRKATVLKAPDDQAENSRWNTELRAFVRRHGTLLERFPDADYPAPAFFVIFRHVDDCHYLEVIDNAPAFRVEFDYPQNPTPHGLGLKVCFDIERALSKAGAICWFEPVRALTEAERDSLAALPELAGLQDRPAEDFSITRFALEASNA